MANDQQVRQLELLHRATVAFNASLDLDDIFHTVLEEVRHALQATGWAVWVLDERGTELTCRQAAGPGGNRLIGFTMPASLPLLAPAIHDGQSVLISDSRDERLFRGHVALQRGAQVRSLVIAPLRSLDPGGDLSTVGVVVVISDSPNAFSTDDKALVDALAASASVAIRNGRLYQQAKQEIEVRRRAERALRESEGHYRTLVETSPDAVVLVDLRGHIQMCNRRTLELFGYTHVSDLLGRTYLSLFPPEARPRAMRGFESVLQGSTLQDAESPLLRGDGTLFEGEIAAALAANNSGEPASIVGFARDITERKEAETAIRRHNEELRVLNDVATRISSTQNLDQLLETALDKTLTALEVDTGWIALYQPVLPARAEAGTEIRIYRGVLAEADFRARRESLLRQLERLVIESQQATVRQSAELLEHYTGVAASCPVVAVPLIVEGAAAGVMGIVGLDSRHPRQIHTRQVQLLSAIGHQVSIAVENARLSAQAAEVEMLRELERMRTELIANFSHDLKTPLGLIEMSVSTLQRDDIMLSPQIEEDLLQDVITQTRRLAHLVEGILDLGRLENGQLQLNRVPVDLGALMVQVSEGMQRRYTQHTFIPAAHDAPLVAVVDPDRIEQVLYNLLDNAAKYSPGGGEIRLTGHLDGDFIYITIADQGVGIPETELPFIFERFYRVQDPATEGITGVGLGLPSCKGIVEAHGGEIWAASIHGTGSTFYFTVPAHASLGFGTEHGMV